MEGALTSRTTPGVIHGSGSNVIRQSRALLNESRSEAVDRMVEQARQAGANAIVNIRFSTSNIAAGAAEVMAYGTAVVVS